jgi:hypothetical protein
MCLRCNITLANNLFAYQSWLINAVYLRLNFLKYSTINIHPPAGRAGILIYVIFN